MNRQAGGHNVADMRRVRIVFGRLARVRDVEILSEGEAMDVNGVAAIVTGAASGLGEATARALARRGAKVAVFDRDAERGEQVASEIGGSVCDVDGTSDETGVAAF